MNKITSHQLHEKLSDLKLVRRELRIGDARRSNVVRRHVFPISFVSDGLWICVFLRPDAAVVNFRFASRYVSAESEGRESCSVEII